MKQLTYLMLGAFLSLCIGMAHVQAEDSLLYEQDTALDMSQASATEQQAYAHYQHAVKYLQEGKYAAALQEENAEIRLKPQDASAYIRRGAIYEQLKQPAQAMADYNHALALDPLEWSGWANRGALYLRQKEYEKGRQDLTQALTLATNPQLKGWLLYNRSIAYMYMKQYTEALADIQQWIDEEPQNRDAYLAQSNIYMALGQTDKAVASQQRAGAMGLEQQGRYFEAGEIYGNYADTYENAIDMFSKDIARQPSAIAYSERGLIYAKCQRQKEAIADFTKALALSPDPMDYNNRGEAYRELKEYDKAAADFQKALQMKPADAYTLAALYDSMGMLAWDLGKYQEAVTNFTTSLTYGKDARTYEYRSKAYEKLGETKKAKDDAAEAARLQQEGKSQH